MWNLVDEKFLGVSMVDPNSLPPDLGEALPVVCRNPFTLRLVRGRALTLRHLLHLLWVSTRICSLILTLGGRAILEWED